MKRQIAACAAVIAGLAACTTGQVSGFSAPLGTDPLLAGGSYTSGGGITIALSFRRADDGGTAVCGVWAESGAQSALTRDRAPRVLQTARVSLDGRTLLSNLGFLREVPPAADYAGRDASCAITGRPWPGQGAMQAARVDIPRQTVFRDIDDTGGVVEIHFNPTGPAAGG
ncbi:hypothetical protein [Roseovarius salinarum]|uniref:hypothetical protein n=1 Tax=Roseovarius salinarum TaxID=1981892 RepID=UPI000C332702|nr:hypothetical protein [Roseovarius salinarum]